jgi:hypothetical protein
MREYIAEQICSLPGDKVKKREEETIILKSPLKAFPQQPKTVF